MPPEPMCTPGKDPRHVMGSHDSREIPNYWSYANFKLSERLNVQLRGEAFNIFNHTNFAGISTNFSSSAFGGVTSVRDPRQIQLGMKLEF